MNVTIDWLHVSILLNILGILWSIYRELLIFDLSKRLSRMGGQVIKVVQGSAIALEKLQSNIIDSARGDRTELMHSLRSLEERLASLIRDVRSAVSGVTVIQSNRDETNFQGPVNRANINSGDGQQTNS